MAKPLSLAKFLETVERSNLLEPGKLSAYCQEQPEHVTAKDLAENMVRDGLLTQFQVDNLLKGRWGRYFMIFMASSAYLPRMRVKIGRSLRTDDRAKRCDALYGYSLMVFGMAGLGSRIAGGDGRSRRARA